jgi:putative flippase GtrA
MSNTKSLVHLFKNVYTYSIITAGTIGTMYGLKTGYDCARIICFQKKELTNTEYIGEVVCFSGITISSAILHGVLSSLLTSTLPVTAPTALGYKLYTDLYTNRE